MIKVITGIFGAAVLGLLASLNMQVSDSNREIGELHVTVELMREDNNDLRRELDLVRADMKAINDHFIQWVALNR